MPTTVIIKSQVFNRQGATHMHTELPNFVQYSPEPKFSQQLDIAQMLPNETDLAGAPFEVREKGTGKPLLSGSLDADGVTSRVFTKKKTDVEVFIGNSKFLGTHDSMDEDTESSENHLDKDV